ncbi:hypothetical protein M409DRAFT_64694 [Zasmidium cellare ATCC 36951]|uniref:Cullin family profile domain-containing protein n=1 Tax=Zasmidium cellare ATCC 36951 TaxID=1080233 RepID=A0A6A6CTW0_ZASCE|nr:uncharacterized protein M409DRAFT_64694 [Zasmidium cellare ATCC 36951]KAF2169618.1 hypothetical protein M409DRAFT_64694 [Zasmidium cellare ATCC 36951]
MAATALRPAHGDDIFSSVFPPKDHTTPTPEATPNIGTLASPGGAFGGFDIPNNAADEAAKLNRAWSIATRFLTLSAGLTEQSRNSTHSPDVDHALHFLLDSPSARKDLLDWYMHEVSTHFRHFILPGLSFWQQAIPVDKTHDVFSKTVQVLRKAQDVYLNTGDDYEDRHDLQEFMTHIKQDFHVLVLNSLPRQRIQKTLASYLFQSMKSSLKDSSNPEKCTKSGRCQCHINLDLDALTELHHIGLGGSHGQRAFAHALHKFIEGPATERRCFQVDWNHHTSVIAKLRTWVEDQFMPSVQQAVATLTGESTIELPLEQFMSAAVSSFGRQRVSALFDYVNSWPASEGAILDIREYINANGPGEKVQLCSSFTDQIQSRLLHAGASTTEILSVYMNVISVFKLLDARGVLLEKVAIPIRSYLRNREDTVQVIAASLLAEVDENGEVHAHDLEKICSDITIEIANSTVDAQDDRLLNWDDMEWVPDPIDAGPNYKSSRSDDIVGYILGLFDADDFIKALAAAFGEHLIRSSDTELVKELRLVELLKSRLDASKLQQAEVMLKDMRDSVNLNRRINPTHHMPQGAPKPTPKDVQAALPEDGITVVSLWERFRGRMERQEFSAALHLVARHRNGLYFPKRARLSAEAMRDSPAAASEEIGLHFGAKIVSGCFWPQLRDLNFAVPDQIKQHMAHYEQAFTAISGQRKLEWKHGAGSADIKLEFEDRVVEENGIEEWKATLVDAFGLPTYDNTMGASVAELQSSLQMDEDLVLSALSYWIGKKVLYEKSPGKFAVLERLDMHIEQVEDTQADLEMFEEIDPETKLLRENALMYQNFIEGMLRNQGPKEISGMLGITGMMRMVLPGFVHSDDDVKWLLDEMEGKGKVKSNAGGTLWAVV